MRQPIATQPVTNGDGEEWCTYPKILLLVEIVLRLS